MKYARIVEGREFAHAAKAISTNHLEFRKNDREQRQHTFASVNSIVNYFQVLQEYEQGENEGDEDDDDKDDDEFDDSKDDDEPVPVVEQRQQRSDDNVSPMDVDEQDSSDQDSDMDINQGY